MLNFNIKRSNVFLNDYNGYSQYTQAYSFLPKRKLQIFGRFPICDINSKNSGEVVKVEI